MAYPNLFRNFELQIRNVLLSFNKFISDNFHYSYSKLLLIILGFFRDLESLNHKGWKRSPKNYQFQLLISITMFTMHMEVYCLDFQQSSSNKYTQVFGTSHNGNALRFSSAFIVFCENENQ